MKKILQNETLGLKIVNESLKSSILLATIVSIAWWVIASLVEWLVFGRTHTFLYHYAMMGWQEWFVRMTTVVMLFWAMIIRGSMQQARKRIEQLEGMIPFCAWCKKQIRTESGSWQDVDVYLQGHDVAVTHSMCPECFKKTLKMIDKK